MYSSSRRENLGSLGGYHGIQRPRMMESNPYFAESSQGFSDVHKNGAKRPRVASEPVSYYPIAIGGSSFQNTYNGSRMIGGAHSFPVVHLRGLPFDCSEMDIANFFVGLGIVDCLLINKDGRFNGEALVVFSSLMQVELALQRNRQSIGHRYIEICQSSKLEYYNAVAAEFSNGRLFDQGFGKNTPARTKKTFDEKYLSQCPNVLKLRGLPYSVTRAEIVQFFGKEYGLKEEDVHILYRFDGKATGEAFAEFASPDLAQKAMCMDRMTIGSRYVELFSCKPDEVGK